jgi:chromosome partitioning protein
MVDSIRRALCVLLPSSPEKADLGKTTVADHLDIAAHLAGMKTLVADTDPQGSAIDVLSARTGDGPAYVASTPAELVPLQLKANPAVSTQC